MHWIFLVYVQFCFDTFQELPCVWAAVSKLFDWSRLHDCNFFVFRHQPESIFHFVIVRACAPLQTDCCIWEFISSNHTSKFLVSAVGIRAGVGDRVSLDKGSVVHFTHFDAIYCSLQDIYFLFFSQDSYFRGHGW